MTTRTYFEEQSEREGFFGVLARKQSYLNIFYLLLSFPMGVFYFVFLVTGLSLGIGLSIIGIGIFILLMVLAASRGLTAWERLLAIWLLDADIPTKSPGKTSWRHPWSTLKVLVADPRTWTGLAFLFVKFPLGILSFVVAITLISLTLSLLLSPLVFRFIPISLGFWEITSSEDAFLCMVLGLGVGLISIHIMIGLAAVWRWLATGMLGVSRARQEKPVISRPGPIVIP